MSDEWIKDPYAWAHGKSDFVWTEFERTKNLLQLYCQAEFIKTETVLLHDGGNHRTYYKLKVKDLWQAYAVMYQSLI